MKKTKFGKTEAVVFDGAGTIIDSGSKAPAVAFQMLFAEWGIDVTMAEAQAPMGIAKRDHIVQMFKMPRIEKLWVEKYGKKADAAVIDALYTKYETILLSVLGNSRYSEPTPHALEALEYLRKHGYKVAGTTGYSSKIMNQLVPSAKKQGVDIDTWLTPDQVGGKGRPDPAMLLEVARRLGVDPKSIVKIGDTKVDILEGVNAGSKSVGIVEGSSESGMTSEEFSNLMPGKRKTISNTVTNTYKNKGAHQVISNLSKIEDVIEK